MIEYVSIVDRSASIIKLFHKVDKILPNRAVSGNCNGVLKYIVHIDKAFTD